MAKATLSGLMELAQVVRPAHQAFVDSVRAFARAHGVEVVDLRPADLEGAWDVRLRALTPAESAAAAVSSPARLDESAPVIRRPLRPPAFDSPVRQSPPFDGDGTDDIMRFIGNADASTRVPGRGGPAAGAEIRILSVEERVGLLAPTIAGDVVLSLQHRGLAGDLAAVEEGLAHARNQYLSEAARSGAPGTADEWAADFDRVAADLCHTLLQAR